MLRLIIAAVLASACLAYPQRREGAPANAAPNLQPFDGGMPAMNSMPNLQPMQGMPMAGMAGPQFLPFNPNLAMGLKRDVDVEKRRQHSQFSDDNKSPFDSEGLGDFMNFMKGNGDSLPFANMDSADTDLGHFEPSAENGDGKFRFFDKEQ